MEINSHKSKRSSKSQLKLFKTAAFGSHTSSAMSTPEGNGALIDNAKNQSLQEFLKSYPRKEPMRPSPDKERNQSGPSRCKTSEELSKATTIKGCKSMELKKNSSNHSASYSNQAPRKQPRKGDNPVRLPSTEVSVDSGCPSTWTCKNSACKAVLSTEDTFCKRCSCCICHLFDDNKDPSLWLVCSSESGGGDWCGWSCHIECALQCGKAGVVDHGQFMRLDGSYCCASCGKVSGIIGSWRKQLAIAKDARRVDVLCYRIFLSYRLLDGSARFKELHKIVDDAKAKLEKEVGAVNGVSAKMARGIVSRLSVASDVQRLCTLAIEKADEWLNSNVNSDPEHGDSLPAACRFQFEEISSSSLVIVLKETTSSAAAADSIKGYKLWYYKTRDEEPWKKEPVTFPRAQRRILISNLKPCTEYAFRIISFTELGDLGHSEAKCFTKSVEIIPKQHVESNGLKREPKTRPDGPSPGFKVRKLGKILQLAWAQEEDGLAVVKPEADQADQAEPSGVARRLDLNLAAVPDLNAEVAPPVEDANANEEICDGDSALVDGSPLRFSNGFGFGQLDENYEYCVKVVRWLECTGHIEGDFRMKFLTWFSLRSNEQERRVVITFIRTLVDEPGSLAGQLVDSFAEIVACKRLRNGFCSKLWH